MALSEHIQDLIVAYKAKPQSEWKNRTVSHLQNALATSHMLEMDELAGQQVKARTEPYNASREFINQPEMNDHAKHMFCKCPTMDGQIAGFDKDCPIHGKK